MVYPPTLVALSLSLPLYISLLLLFLSLSLSFSREVGDGTNFVMVLSGALITNAEELLKMGLSPSEVAEGYEMACEKALAILPGEVGRA